MKYFKAISVTNRLSLILMVANLLSVAFNFPFVRGYLFPWACLICFLYYCLRSNESRIKYILFPIIFIPLALMSDWRELLMTSLVFAGGLYLVSIYDEKPDFNLMLSIFKREYKMIFVFSLIAVFLFGSWKVSQHVAPYLIINMITATVILRTTRFIEHNIEDKRANRLNAAYSIFASIIAIILSVEEIRSIVGKATYVLYLALIRVFYYITSGLIYIIGKPLDRLIIAIKEGGGKPFKGGGKGAGGNELGEALYASLYRSPLADFFENPIVVAVIQVLLLFLVVFIIYKTTRRYWSTRLEDADEDPYEEEKESIRIERVREGKGVLAKLGEMLRPRTLEEQIRHHYSKMLGILKNRGIEINTWDTSYDVNKKAAGIYDNQILEEIRNIYIAIRYGGRKADKDSSKKIGELVRKGDK